MSEVLIERLNVSLGGQPILRDLDLQVSEGEFLVLLGPSGCGKSTLLGAIAGLVAVESGRILIGGDDVTDRDPAERHIGMVFQSYALYPTMTVERNLSFGLRVRGTPRAEVERRVRDAAALLQLTPLLDRRPAALSGGQRQRVAIGRALVRDAGVYLLDEPLSNLDAALRTSLRRELKALHRRLGATMIYVTHDQVEAVTLATRIAILRNGVLQQVGTPAELYRAPANRFVAGFLGTPTMNFVEGEIHRHGAGRRFVAAGLELACPVLPDDARTPTGPVTLGLRPEHVRIGQGPYAAVATAVESIGPSRVVTLDASGTQLAALAPDDSRIAEGDTVRFDVEPDRLSFFDRNTEARL